MNKYILALNCFNAALSVGIAAAGGHKKWDLDVKLSFQKAFFLHLTSSIGGIIAGQNGFTSTSAMFFIGSLLFSIPLDVKCFQGTSTYTKLMPYGGMLIIGGWLSMGACYLM